MRGDYEREKTSILTWLLSAIIAGFILQLVVDSLWVGVSGRFDGTLGLSVLALEAGRVWTLLSHAFLHSTEFPVHVIFNVLALFFLGRELLPMLGTKRFLGIFAAATIVGGLAWCGAHWTGEPKAIHLGASAAVYAFFTVFACFFPNQQIPFLLFFVFPVTLKPKLVAYALFALSLLSLIAYEIPGEALPLGMVISSSAHLGGMLVGFLYYRFVHDSQWSFGSPDRPEMELPRWLKRTRKAPAAAPAYQINIEAAPPPPARDIRAEIDRILDKINSEGFGSLTPEEKRVLDQAKDVMSRR